MDLQERVIQKIKSRLMTQKQLADELDISNVTLTKVVNGKHVSNKTLRIIDERL